MFKILKRNSYYIAISFLFILYGCTTSPEKVTESNTKILDSLYRQDSIYKTQKKIRWVRDSIRNCSLGGLKLLEFDTDTKCNLTYGYYIINKKIKDSASLAFLAKFYADSLQENATHYDCIYPVMTALYIYSKPKDYLPTKNSSRNIEWPTKWIANCIITPNDPDGQVSVNHYYLDTVANAQKR